MEHGAAEGGGDEPWMGMVLERRLWLVFVCPVVIFNVCPLNSRLALRSQATVLMELVVWGTRL